MVREELVNQNPKNIRPLEDPAYGGKFMPIHNHALHLGHCTDSTLTRMTEDLADIDLLEEAKEMLERKLKLKEI